MQFSSLLLLTASLLATHIHAQFEMPDSFDEAIDAVDAPTVIGRPSGKDEGNSFCLGGCYATQEEAPCGQPYSKAVFKEEEGCWVCCFTDDF
ncbi:hypothetical protein N7474_007224 [Penicillium riverlandense]|uniref:uncharacterized protein n=1 Tax=Penicillium riverlandense TaxID=1903569 RepID=UPI00254971B3|nr:uncharacterized protein N7474_007224 [Penicillium riverlandense]KAJ5815447.1 hypothetical protein N7474_007224 [Penicillium riverlandense]